MPEYPIETRLALQAAVKALLGRENRRSRATDPTAGLRKNRRVRMTRATDPLVGLRPEDFPERIRGRATRVLAARGAHAKQYRHDTTFFEELSQKEFETLVDDILVLYETCLIDVGKMGSDDFYLED